MKFMTSIFAALVLAACTTSSVVRTGELHAPINPEQVRVFFEAPEDYRVLGSIDVHSNIVFSNRKAQDRAIKPLIEDAAAIGANGVLINFEADYPTETLVFDPHLPIYTVEMDFTKVLSAAAILLAPAIAAN